MIERFVRFMSGSTPPERLVSVRRSGDTTTVELLHADPAPDPDGNPRYRGPLGDLAVTITSADPEVAAGPWSEPGGRMVWIVQEFAGPRQETPT